MASINLFTAIGEKMAFLNKRQEEISRNIANADTPGYQPKDVKDVDFSAILKNVAGETQDVKLATTTAGHMTPAGEMVNPISQKQKRVFEVAPAGNAVVIEEQMMKAGATSIDYNLMVNLYQRNTNMLRTALGRV